MKLIKKTKNKEKLEKNNKKKWEHVVFQEIV